MYRSVYTDEIGLGVDLIDFGDIQAVLPLHNEVENDSTSNNICNDRIKSDK